MAAGLAGAEPTDTSGTRGGLAEARSVLWSGDAGRAVGLLRAHLAASPRDLPARLDLAHACAWSGDYAGALTAYSAVVDAVEHPPRSDGERVDALDTAPLVPADDLLVGALDGIADVLDWAGRKAEARAARKRVAALRPGDAALQTKALRAERDAEPYARSVTRFTSDSDRREALASRLSLDAGESNGGLWLVGFDHVRFHDVRMGARAEEYGFAIGRRQLVAPGTTAEGSVRVHLPGAASPVDGRGDAAVDVSARLEHRLLSGPSVSLDLASARSWLSMSSLRAHETGLRAFDLAVTGYDDLGGLGLWARLHAGSTSDGNRSASIDMSGDWAWTGATSLGIGVRAVDHRRESEDYYAPQREMNVLASLRSRATLLDRVALRAGASTGIGRNAHGSGVLFACQASADVSGLGPLSLALAFDYSESIQTTTYVARAFTAMVRLN
jgi:hypothetical protein